MGDLGGMTMQRNLTVFALAGLLVAACGPPPALRLSDEPVTGDGLHLVRHRGQGRMVVAPDLDRVRAKIGSSDSVMLRSCQITLKDRSREQALASQMRQLTDEICSVFRRSIDDPSFFAEPSGTTPVRETRARLVDTPGPDTMALELWLINVELDEASGAVRQGSNPTLGILYTESLNERPLLRYYGSRRFSGSVEDYLKSSMTEVYTIYSRLLFPGGRTDVAAPAP